MHSARRYLPRRLYARFQKQERYLSGYSSFRLTDHGYREFLGCEGSFFLIKQAVKGTKCLLLVGSL